MMTLVCMTMIDLLNGMKAIQNEKLKKQRLRKSSYPLLGIPQERYWDWCMSEDEKKDR